MMKQNRKEDNFLAYIPKRNENIPEQVDSNGRIVLLRVNTGFYNRIAQKLFAKPRVSYIHLDETGNFIWPLLDGAITVEQLGDRVREHFGADAEPLYERLVKYLQILSSYGFITLCAPGKEEKKTPPETSPGEQDGDRDGFEGV